MWRGGGRPEGGGPTEGGTWSFAQEASTAPPTNTLSPPRPCCALLRPLPRTQGGACFSPHFRPRIQPLVPACGLPRGPCPVQGLWSRTARLRPTPHHQPARRPTVMADVATQPLPQQQQPPAPAPAAAEAQPAEPAKAEPAKPSFEDDPKAALKAGLEETDEQILFSCGCTEARGGRLRVCWQARRGPVVPHIHGCTHAGVCLAGRPLHLAGGPLHRRPPWTHLSPCASTAPPRRQHLL